MDFLSRSSIIFKVEHNNEEYTCMLHKGKKYSHECIEDWQSMTIFEPNNRKYKVNFIPQQFEGCVYQNRSILYDYELSFKNLNDYVKLVLVC